MEKIRLNIECECTEIYSRLLEPKGEVVVTCPFCKCDSKLVFESHDKVNIYRDTQLKSSFSIAKT